MSLIEILKKYFSIVFKTKGSYLAAIVFLSIGTLFSKSLPIFYGWIVDNLQDNKFEIAVSLVVVLLVVKIIGTLIKLLGDHFIDIVLLNAQKNARLEYVQSLQNMDYEYHINKSSGSLISLAKRGENAIFNAVIQVNTFVLVTIVEFILAIVVISMINLTLGSIVLLVLIINLIIGSILIKYNITKRREINKMDDQISGLTVDNLIGFETVKIFGNETYEQTRFKKAYIPWMQKGREYVMTFRWLDGFIGILSGLGIFILFIIAINLVQNQIITTGEAVSALVFVFGLNRGYADIIFNIRDMAKNYTDLKRYFETMNLVPKISSPTEPKVIDKPKGEIRFSNVEFEYPSSDTVLHDINLTIKDGETVALVGESGSGKTTFTRLVLRFYDTTEGEILIDNINIKDLDQQNLRKLIGVVPQDPVLFNDTAKYNISYAHPDSDLEEVILATKKAQLHEFIDSLPKKYDSIVGERGIKLSGGQKQRLAIARVILENPHIIVFDEATSQLDSKTEKKVQKAFEILSKDKTTIIIAHRLSTIVNADRILVFDKGRIVDEGRHDELIEKSDIYKHLWELQTQGYEL